LINTKTGRQSECFKLRKNYLRENIFRKRKINDEWVRRQGHINLIGK